MANTANTFTATFRDALRRALEKEAEEVMRNASKQFEGRARSIIAEFSLNYARSAELTSTGEHELSFTLKIDPRRLLDGSKP